MVKRVIARMALSVTLAAVGICINTAGGLVLLAIARKVFDQEDSPLPPVAHILLGAVMAGVFGASPLYGRHPRYIVGAVLGSTFLATVLLTLRWSAGVNSLGNTFALMMIVGLGTTLALSVLDSSTANRHKLVTPPK